MLRLAHLGSSASQTKTPESPKPATVNSLALRSPRLRCCTGCFIPAEARNGFSVDLSRSRHYVNTFSTVLLWLALPALGLPQG